MRRFGFLGGLSITFKLILGAVFVNLAAFASSILIVDRMAGADLQALAIDGWAMRTGQIAAAAAGGIGSKTPDLVAEAYAGYQADPDRRLLMAAAFGADTVEIAGFVAPGVDAAPIEAAIAALVAAAPETIRTTRLDGSVVMVAPAGRAPSGRPLGHIALAWNTAPIEDVSGSLYAGLALVQTVSTLFLIVLLSWIVGRLICKPLRALAGRVDALAAGDLDPPVAQRRRVDEIGHVARALEDFRAILAERRAADRDVEAQRHDIERERVRNEAARAAAAKLQSAVVRLLGAGLVRLADGDLTTRLTVDVPAEFRKFRDDFNRAMDRLQDTIGRVADTGCRLESGAGGVRAAAVEFARRAEQQAAALEQTVAAVNDVASSVTATAKGAAETRAAMSEVARDADRAATVVSQTIVAMTGIEKSSREITKITGVIDEIAFQTNLLALNARVEAARAGEAGKGFAVVAQEVRALARRSAEAAREIKQLIKVSASEVKDGTRLVSETGEFIDSIGGRVGSLDAIVSIIAKAAEEQAQTLRDVDRAINGIDAATRRGAALAEQFAATGHTVAHDGAALMDLIADFRVEAGYRVGGPASLTPSHQAGSPPVPRAATDGATALALDAETDGWREF
ncbi:HAMP domain-containing protein [Nitratireductor sp. CAU 1489]|uniref:HAMP domain-containing protein n=1 Tax=Nitratireductor arenosus TaxID=2682096 RepID=A0A844QJA7_9HYPH|nr:methyl-accepting chemotaxis protein [Nitratireductor arenosus]MVA98011.1 HAMP domain-containing protein [Nitratireductor arenosus]